MLQTVQDTTVAVLDHAAAAAISEKAPEGIERLMLAEDKLPVVLSVVMIVWLGLLVLMARTERRLRRTEQLLAEREAEQT